MIIGIYGNSNSGKTGLIERILKPIESKGYDLCIIKHSHESFDKENKDTWRFKKAEAKHVFLTGKDGVIYFTDDNLKFLIDTIQKIKRFDLILIEGYKKESWLKKIRVGDCEEESNTAITYKDDNQIIEYITNQIEIEKILNQLGGIDCGKCGYPTCEEFAEHVYEKQRVIEDCKYLKKNGVELIIDDKAVELGKFPEDVIKNIIQGFVKSIKTEKEPKKITINLDLK